VTAADVRLTQLIAEVCDLPAAGVGPDDRFADLGNWGSMTALRLLTAIEEAFGIHLDLRRYLAMETVRELTELVTAELVTDPADPVRG
jgi:acyl carrier protein